jgi:peptidoglycan/xylan/chitin deacetylase (PgdA/CDA1 family)
MGPLVNASKPLASLSLDLDDLWTYLRTRGDPAWTDRPTYLPVFVPRVLDELDRLGLRLTVFVVGSDAARGGNLPLLRSIADRGHELANHSFSHECWMHLHSREKLHQEIGRTEDAIGAVTGQAPVGFRGPGFSWSPTLLEVLAERGYRYDASTLPTYLGPLSRAYFLATAKLTPRERKQRSALFGSAREGRRPVGAYRWRLAGGATLLEIPNTTIPLVKAPFHMSYLLYLRRFSRRLMLGYLRLALAACRAHRVQPSFLLHPLDLLTREEAPQLSFFPGMSLPGDQKRQAVAEVLGLLVREYQVLTLDAHAERLLAAGGLPEHAPGPAPDVSGTPEADKQYDGRWDHAQAS